jgi:hypothetical protein
MRNYKGSANGGRKQKSAIDAAMVLQHEIQTAKYQDKAIASVLFMDIKGAYDHVSTNQLLRVCQDLGLPYSVGQWI